MKIGDTVYLSSAPLDNLPYYTPREAIVTNVGTVMIEAKVEWLCQPQWYMPEDVFATREQAQERIIAMARRARDIANAILEVSA